jgi:hypothetical protein
MLGLLVATTKILEVKAETSLNLAHLPCQPACPNRPTCLVSCLCLFLASGFFCKLICLKQSSYFCYMSMAKSDSGPNYKYSTRVKLDTTTMLYS